MNAKRLIIQARRRRIKDALRPKFPEWVSPTEFNEHLRRTQMALVGALKGT